MTKILDGFHYKAAMIIEDQYFKDLVAFLLSKLKSFGCPIPDKGFKDYKEYEAWRNLYWKISESIQTSKNYQTQLSKIKTEKGLKSFRQDKLPPLFKIYIKEIVNYYKIKEEYQKYFEEFFFNYIFFNKGYYPHPNFTISWKKNKKTNENELYVRVFGHTTKEDIVKNWDIIKEEKKLLNGWLGKNKSRNDFKRDLEIYKFYKTLSQDKDVKRGKEENIYRARRMDEKISAMMVDKHGDLTWENIRKIINRMKRLDKEFVTSKETI